MSKVIRYCRVRKTYENDDVFRGLLSRDPNFDFFDYPSEQEAEKDCTTDEKIITITISIED